MKVFAWLKRHLELVGILAIVVVACALRSIDFATIPVALYWDEMAIWNDALSIRATGLDLHARSWFQPLFISYGDYKLPVYIWLVSLVSWFTDNALVATRLPSRWAGVSMVLASYLLWKWLIEGFGSQKKIASWLAVVPAAVVAIIPWSLHFSTVGFESHVSSAFLMWSMVAVAWSFRAKKFSSRSAAIALSVFLGVLSVYTYFSTRFVWPVVFLSACALWFQKTRKHWWVYGLGLIIWVVALVPMLQADFYQESNRLRLSTENIMSIEQTQPLEINAQRERSGNTLVSRIIYNRPTMLSLELVKNIGKHLDPEFLFIHGDQKPRHGVPNVGLLYSFMAPFLVIGVVALWKEEWRMAAWLSLWWLVALVPAAVPTDTPHALRSLNAVLPIGVFVAAGLIATVRWWWQQSWYRLIKIGGLFLLGSIAVFQMTQYFALRKTVYPMQSAEAWQAGYTPLAKYIAEHRSEYDRVFVDMFDERFYLYYQPYSGLSWQEIQSQPSNGFKRQDFGTVHIQLIDTASELPAKSMVVISVEKHDRIEIEETWKQKEIISNEIGEEAFVIYETIAE